MSCQQDFPIEIEDLVQSLLRTRVFNKNMYMTDLIVFIHTIGICVSETKSVKFMSAE